MLKMNIESSLQNKYLELKKYLSSLNSVAVAYSSGVDSTFLLKTAVDTLSRDNVLALTAKSHSFPKRELDESIQFCKSENIRQIVFESEELSIDGFSNNPPDRCYICKKELFSKIKSIARENNINAVIEGSNADDINDYRPGMRAVAELEILSPLKKVGLTKNEIRALSKQHGLKTWNKQSFACLSSRFVYGEKITVQKLDMIDKSEQLLLDLGFKQVRVRIHNDVARIEVLPNEIERVMQFKDTIYSRFKEYGFRYVTLDLGGYRTGSMNDSLNI